MSISHKRGRGFILKDYLLGLLIVVIMIPLLNAPYRLIDSLKFNDDLLLDIISIEKLKRELLMTEIIEVKKEVLDYLKEGEERKLIFNDHRLYLSPGYQLFLKDVDDLSFSYDGEGVYMTYLKDGKYEKIAF